MVGIEKNGGREDWRELMFACFFGWKIMFSAMRREVKVYMELKNSLKGGDKSTKFCDIFNLLVL